MIHGIVGFDTFKQKLIVLRDTPWKTKAGSDWSDYDDGRLAEWLQIREVRVSPDIAHQAAILVAQSDPHRFDSLCDYLNGLTHDGEPRVHELASRFFGAVPGVCDTFMRFAVIAAVARAMQPGCKADHVVVLEGAQGERKSTALRTLFDPLDKRWFRDSLPPLEKSTDAALQLMGAWCVEISELDAIRKSEVSAIKAFISRQVDSFRPPYGRGVSDFARRTVFFATTNEGQYLQDSTGNRRWWPIRCGKIDVDGLVADRDQIWAEAMALYTDGKAWWFEDRESERRADAEAEERRSIDPWEDLIATHMIGQTETSVADVLLQAVEMEASRWTQREQNRVARILLKQGFKRKQVRRGGGREWIYGRE